jgi:peptidoglycan/LPS O-acetylase OafA/YrhL
VALPPPRESASYPVKGPRFKELDALRGLAACTVVFNHFYNLHEASNQPFLVQLLFRGLLRFLVAGHEAVLLFFVLSGFVLTQPFLKPNKPLYVPFLVKRICRIQLPYLGGLGLAILGDLLFHNSIPSLSLWFQMMWSEPLTWHLVLQHVGLIGFFNEVQLNTAFWSLVVEMRISIVFPLLMLLLSRVRTPRTMILAGSAALLLIAAPFEPQSGNLSSVINTLQYGMSFVIGSLLARSHESCSKLYLQLPRLARPVLWVGLLAVWSFVGVISSKPALLGLYNMILTLASAGIIVIAMTEPWVRTALLHRIPQYLGHVSYSVYLIHVTVLLSLVHALYGKCSLLALLPMYIALTFMLGTVFHTWIEEPCTRLGTVLAAKIQLHLSPV